MKMNIFEGSRRVRLLLQILWVAGVLLIAWNEKIYLPATFQTYGPYAPFTGFIEGVPCSAPDASKYTDRKTKYGTKVAIILCFKAMKFSNGEMLIPYHIDEKNTSTFWGASSHSDQVSKYMDMREKYFQLSDSDQESLDQVAFKKRLEYIQYALGIAAAGCLVIWLIFAIIGWVMRGFMGIPLGHDVRIEKEGQI